MKSILIVFILLLSTLILTNCSEDDPTSSSEPSYQLFPDGYFSPGFREEYSMAGSSPGGQVLQGTHLELTQDIETFNGQQVYPVLIQNDWVDTNTNTPFSNSALFYYLADPDNRKNVGAKDLITQITLTFANTENIPISAKIGDSGQINTYTDVFGNVQNLFWDLQSSTNGRAKIVWGAETRDTSNVLISELNTTYEIEPNGNRVSMTILFDFKAFADPVSWIGTKL